ncbi:MAG TPA: hypothetical protein VI390_06750, partial [Methyloceanibacter sp.]
DRYRNSQTTGEGFAGAMAYLFTGLLGGGFGANNPALQQFNNAIANDIKAQEANLANKGEAADRAKGLYGLALQRIGSPDAARNLAHAAYMDAAQSDLQRLMAEHGTDEAKRNGDALIAEIELKKQEYLAKAMHGPSTSVAQMDNDTAARIVDLGDGQQGIARDKTGADALRELQPKIQQYVANNEEIMQLRDQLFAAKDWTQKADIVSRLNSLDADQSLLQKDFNHLGQIAGADVGLMSKARPGALSIRPGANAGIKESSRFARQMLGTAYRAQLSHVVATPLTRNSKGVVAPSLVYLKPYSGEAPKASDVTRQTARPPSFQPIGGR